MDRVAATAATFMQICFEFLNKQSRSEMIHPLVRSKFQTKLEKKPGETNMPSVFSCIPY